MCDRLALTYSLMKALTAGVPYNKLQKYVKLVDSELEKEMTETAFRSHSKEGKVPDVFNKYSIKNINAIIDECTKYSKTLKVLGMKPARPKEANEIDSLAALFGTKDEYGGVSIIDRKTANTVDEILGGARRKKTKKKPKKSKKQHVKK